MRRSTVLTALTLSLSLAVGLSGCGADQSEGTRPVGHDGGTGGGAVPCPNPPKDTDGDGISDHDEGADETPPRDTDHDGKPDFQDPDSDNDGIPDAIEGRNANLCTPPVDSDGDGKADFRDLDSDSPTDSTVPDAEEAGAMPTMPVDSNGNGLPDYADADDDGDGIADQFELTPQGGAVAATTRANAPDTDGDGVPDYLDTDADGDTILDKDEGIVDTDGDLIPNYRDLDSDGDCITDALEAGDTNPNTPPVDTDHDGAPDFEDLDSDQDGLIDHLEDANCNGKLDPCEYDRLNPDTAGKGIGDLIEYQDCRVKPAPVQMQLQCQCWGTNPSSSPLTIGDFVFVVDYMKPPSPTVETLNLATDVSQADVVFMLDSTASTQGALTTLAQSLAGFVPTIKQKVKSIAFGVVDFKDFTDTYVVRYDYKITTVNTTAGVMDVQSALGNLVAEGGADYPEGGWPALYAIAGGPRITANGNYDSMLSPLAPNPVPASEAQGTLGGAGFRAGSVPIIVTETDAAWHDAPGTPTDASGENGLYDYGPGTDCPSNCNGVPSRAMAIAQVQKLNAHVIALAGQGGGAQPGENVKGHGLATATATGAVVQPSDFTDVNGNRPAGCPADQCCTGLNGAGEAPIAGGCPLSYSFDDATGNGVSQSVVSGIVALANGLKFDIHVVASDVDAGTVDNFILKLVPNLTGQGGASICITTTPSPLQDNFSSPHALPGPDGVNDTFPGIGGGKQICFDVTPKMNTTVMNTQQAQFFRAQLQVKGVAGGSTVNLGTPRDVFFLVPPVIKNGPIN